MKNNIIKNALEEMYSNLDKELDKMERKLIAPYADINEKDISKIADELTSKGYELYCNHYSTYEEYGIAKKTNNERDFFRVEIPSTIISEEHGFYRVTVNISDIHRGIKNEIH